MKVCAYAFGACLLLACATQRSATRSTTESPCDRLGRVAASTKPRVFAEVGALDDSDKPVWRELASVDALSEVESYTQAQLWTSADGWLVSMSLSSPSGDWSESINYCFGPDRSLRQMSSSLGTEYADPNAVSRERLTTFSSDGRRLSEVTTVTDLVTHQVVTHGNFQDQEDEAFMTIEALPFYPLTR
jgi:hypothetical protein